MAEDEDKIDLSVTNSLLEPVLLYCVFDCMNDSVVSVAGEVEYETESKNTNALVLCCEFLESLSERLQLARLRVIDIQVRSNVISSEVRHSMVEFALCRSLLVQLMVARAYQVYFLLFRNLVRKLSSWFGRVVYSISLDPVTSIDQN